MREIFAGNGEIVLGKRGENNAMCVIFDVTDWQRDYGDGAYILIYQRNGDTHPYPCVIERNGGYIRWTITNTETDKAGRGKAELQLIQDDVVVKSATYTTRVTQSLAPLSDGGLEPGQAWIDRVLELINNCGGCDCEDGVLTPDDYEGTDTEKLQACFNALAATGGTITLDRKYILNGNINVRHDSNLNHRITVVGVGKHSAIEMQSYSFYGVDSKDIATGGVTFQNVTFTGTGNLVDATNLIRLTFDNCNISGFVNVFESIDTSTDNTGGYMQSLYLTNCLIRSVSGYIFRTPQNFFAFLYDCKVLSCIIEWSGGIAWAGCLQGCSFSHNCIEGMRKDLFYVYCHINQATISENYFEKNNGYLINLKDPEDGVLQDGYCVLSISENNFFVLGSHETAMIKLRTRLHTQSRILIYGNKMPANSTVPLLETDAPDVQTGVFCYGNYGVIIDPNGAIFSLDVNEYKQLCGFYEQQKQYLNGETYWFTRTITAVANSDIALYTILDLPYPIPDAEYDAEFRLTTLYGQDDLVSKIVIPFEVLAKRPTDVTFVAYGNEGTFEAGRSYIGYGTLVITPKGDTEGARE